MKINKIIFSLLLIGLAIVSVHAQQPSKKIYTFEEHVKRVFENWGIVYIQPDQFINLLNPGGWEVFYIRQDKKLLRTYNPVFQSNDKECIIMYASPMQYTQREREMAKTAFHFNQMFYGCDSVSEFKEFSNDRIPRGQIRGELRVSLQIPSEHMDSLFRFDEHVTILSGKAAKEMFNADSIYFYKISLDVPYKDVYNHCLGMISAKKNRASIFFKWFFTDHGKKRQKEYIERLKKAVWYNDDNKKLQEE